MILANYRMNSDYGTHFYLNFYFDIKSIDNLSSDGEGGESSSYQTTRKSEQITSL